MLYVAIDPGKSTGLTIVKDDALVFGCTVDEFNWPWLMDKIEQLCEQEQDVTIITEEYRIYPMLATSQSMQPAWSAEINGMLEYFVHLKNKQGKNYALVKQWASNVKSYVTDDKLKRHGLWKGNKHQKDSARHYVYFIETSQNKAKAKAKKSKKGI